MGTPGPPSLQTLLLRMELHKRCGMSLDEFAALPAREAEEIVVYLQLMQQQEQAEARRGGGHGR